MNLMYSTFQNETIFTVMKRDINHSVIRYVQADKITSFLYIVYVCKILSLHCKYMLMKKKHLTCPLKEKQFLKLYVKCLHA